MATNSTRNLSFAEAQKMWPGTIFNEGEEIKVRTVTSPLTGMQEHFKLGNSDGWGSLEDPRFNTTELIGVPVLEKHFDAMAAKAAKAAETVSNVTIPPETIAKIKEQFANKMETEAVKADNGKPDWSLVPFEALEGMVRVLEFGANKYQAYNFAKGDGLDYTRLISATIRHMSAFARGEDIDPESGLSHIHHCQCNLLFISYFIAHKEKYTKNDNRYKI